MGVMRWPWVWLVPGSRPLVHTTPVLGVASGRVSPNRLGWAVVHRPNKNNQDGSNQGPSLSPHPLSLPTRMPTGQRPYTHIQHAMYCTTHLFSLLYLFLVIVWERSCGRVGDTAYTTIYI
ncbi:hypothetical protein F5Y01DRAFT_223132 [Xylaria sp. FL0043]|nr:hypothetical protein F5Y01DRAFT_223132 [Xylaria sp. FL0043]